MRFDLRFGEGDIERIRQFAMELVALRPDVLIGDGNATTASRCCRISSAEFGDTIR
jgi:hypothetical protein